jgi:putative oxidoreductase
MIKPLLTNELRNTDLGLLVLRIIGGGFMLTHGIPKLMKMLGGDFGFANPLGIGEAPSLVLTVFAEFLCSLAILVGFKTRLACVPAMITMAVAALIIHGGDPWGDKEHALMYFGIYLALMIMGAGKYSVDGRKG